MANGGGGLECGVDEKRKMGRGREMLKGGRQSYSAVVCSSAMAFARRTAGGGTSVYVVHLVA